MPLSDNLAERMLHAIVAGNAGAQRGDPMVRVQALLPVGSAHVYGSVHIINAVGILGVAGSVQVIGSVNVGNAVGVLGVPGSVNIYGSVNVVNAVNIIGLAGSVNVLGSVNVGNAVNVIGLAGSVNVIGSVNVGNAVNIIGLSGSVFVDAVRPGSLATQNTIAAATGNTAFLGANAARKGAYVFNDSPANLVLALGFNATIGAAPANSRFTVRLTASAFYELPSPVFTGAINGVWSGPSGAAQLTEVQ